MKLEGIYDVGNYPGHVLQFWFLVAIAVTLGIVVYALLVYPACRREEYRESPKTSRWVGLLGAMTILFAIGGVAYWINWRNFYILEVYPDKLRLSYFFPERKVEIASADIQKINEQLTSNKGDERCIVVYTAGGGRFVSGPMLNHDFRKVYDSLTEWYSGKNK